MIRFRLFGGLDLTDADGHAIDSILAQPKRVALLAYITLRHDTGYVRRDTLLGMFWPETNQTEARHALRQSLYALRRALGGGVIVNRGVDDVGIDRARLWSDVSAFETHQKNDEFERALELYGGPFLEGFHVSGAREFEKWMDRERTRLQLAAADTAWKLAERKENEGDKLDAMLWAKKASTMLPTSEAVVRKLILFLERLGDKPAALRTYGEYEQYLAKQYELRPDPETFAVVEMLRAADAAGDAGQITTLSVDPPAGDTADVDSPHSADDGAVPAAIPGSNLRNDKPRGRSAALWIVIATLALGAAAWIAKSGPPASDSIAHERVAVASFRNATEVPHFDDLGVAVASAIASGITRIPALDVVPDRNDVHVNYRITGLFLRRGDSLVFQTEIFDAARGRLLPAPDPVSTSPQDPLSKLDEIRTNAIGALGYYTNEFGALRDPQRTPPGWDAYLAFDEGRMHLQRMPRAVRDAERGFRRAIELDPSYTEAYVLLGAGVFFNQPGPASIRGGQIGRFDAIDSLARAMREEIRPLTEFDRNVVQELEAIASGDHLKGVNAAARVAEHGLAYQFGLAFHSAWVNRPRDALRALARLDSDNSWLRDFTVGYWRWETAALHLLGEYEAELESARRGKVRFPGNATYRWRELRALSAMGDVDTFFELGLDGFSPGLHVTLANELSVHGHTIEANRVLAALIDSRSREAWSVVPLSQRVYYATALMLLGRLHESRNVLELLSANEPARIDVMGRLGTVLARLGDERGARAIERELSVINDDYLMGLPTIWRARIVANLNKVDEALDLLEQALSEGVRYTDNSADRGNFWHNDPDFVSLAQTRQYRDLPRPR